ncbi:hypothetical protein [Exiguobacterium mexicanum]|uniref:hypothetical protein n=1 Tax=Exiguobacterium mexicanum TaxID=340146 RepID=UPI0037C12961
MRFEDLFLYDGMMHEFGFHYDIGSKHLTFNLQLSDHPRKRNAAFRERLEANGIHSQSEVVNVKLCFEDIIYMEVIDESYADGVVITPTTNLKEIKSFVTRDPAISSSSKKHVFDCGKTSNRTLLHFATIGFTVWIRSSKSSQCRIRRSRRRSG